MTGICLQAIEVEEVVGRVIPSVRITHKIDLLGKETINQEVLDFHQEESEVKVEAVDREEDPEAEEADKKIYLTISKAYTIQKVLWITLVVMG